jgi:hypothetical protein
MPTLQVKATPGGLRRPARSFMASNAASRHRPDWPLTAAYASDASFLRALRRTPAGPDRSLVLRSVSCPLPTFACRLKLLTEDAVSCAVEFQRITFSVVISCD